MFAKITYYALRHRPIVLALTILFTMAGINAFRNLPVEAYPDVTNVSLQIITLFPGHAAEEVERLVTIPVENEMNGIPKRTSIRSISLFGLSQVTITFEDNADVEFVRNQAVQRLAAVNLPTGAEASLSPNATPVGEIFRYTLRPPRPDYPDVELKALEDWVVERQFRTVPGVVDVVGFGGPTKQYQVLIDPAKLRSYGITLAQVYDALSKGNQNAGGSYIEHGAQLYIVRGLGFIENLDDIRDITVDTRKGTPIRISDVGEVQIGHQVRLGRVGKLVPGEKDQDDVVMGIVIMRRGENVMEVLKRVHAKVEEINRSYLPDGIKIVPHYDRTELTGRTLHTARKNMLEGISLVLLVLILFLGLANYRSALIVATNVPLSLLGAYMLLDLRGIPANLIALGAIDFGIIVDSAVVIVENILHKLEQAPERKAQLHELIIEGVQQMGRPILFAKAILLTAFVPLYTLQSVEGRIFRPMALTLTFALLTGTVLALTLIPALATFAFKKFSTQESRVVQRLYKWYRPLLDRAFNARGFMLGGVALLLVVAGIVLSRIGTEFLPKLDEGSLWVRGFMPQTISPSEASRLGGQVRGILASFPEVNAVVTQLGRPDDGTDVNGWNVIECAVELKNRADWKTAPTREGLIAAMNRKLAALPGVEFQFSQYIEDNVNEAVSGIKSELSVKIFGPDLDKLQSLADQVVEVLKKVPGAVDVSTDQLIGQPQVQIRIKRRDIARYGLAISDVEQIIETALGGSATTRVLEGDRTFDLVVKMSPKAVADVYAIRSIPVFGSNGERLTLGDVTSVDVRTGYSRIWREQNERRTDVKFGVRDRDLGSLISEAKQKVSAEVSLPVGYRLTWAGAFENQQRAVARLKVIVPITLVAIFFLLFTAFDSGRLATLILLVVPFAAVGGLFALTLVGLNLSVAALVGFIVLFGIAMLDGVIMVERISELRRRGLPVLQAIRDGAITRVRPCMMTALMAALGLLPMALSREVGAETSRPFAVVIIGGLFTATFVTLFILPIVYPFFDRSEGGAPTATTH